MKKFWIHRHDLGFDVPDYWDIIKLSAVPAQDYGGGTRWQHCYTWLIYKL